MGITLSVSSQTGLNFNQKTVLHEAGLKNTVSRLMVSAGEWLQSFPWISLYSLGWQHWSPSLCAVLYLLCWLHCPASVPCPRSSTGEHCHCWRVGPEKSHLFCPLIPFHSNAMFFSSTSIRSHSGQHPCSRSAH